MIDIVTVTHNDENEMLSTHLRSQLDKFELGNCSFVEVSNRVNNVGFAMGCNIGAEIGHFPVIGFLNPDTQVRGPFSKKVLDTLSLEDTVITGCRFGKHDRELREWGVTDWVCGAAFFVRRDWFESVGGFDTDYVWSWEETDLIRQAESSGKRVLSINLPISHASPIVNDPVDFKYKQTNFERSRKVFERKWNAK